MQGVDESNFFGAKDLKFGSSKLAWKEYPVCISCLSNKALSRKKEEHPIFIPQSEYNRL